jgi:hypothetical protein
MMVNHVNIGHALFFMVMGQILITGRLAYGFILRPWVELFERW